MLQKFSPRLASPNTLRVSRLQSAALLPPPISRVPGTCTLRPDGLPLDGKAEFNVCICSNDAHGYIAHGYASSGAVIHVPDLDADSVSHVLFWSTGDNPPDTLTMEFTPFQSHGVAVLTHSKTFKRQSPVGSDDFGCVYSAELAPLTDTERNQVARVGMAQYADLKQRLNQSYTTAIAACAALALASGQPVAATACLTGITVGYLNVLGLMARVDGIGKDPLAQEFSSRLLSNNLIRLAGMVALLGTFYRTHAQDLHTTADSSVVVFWLLSGLAIHKLVLFFHGGVGQNE